MSNFFNHFEKLAARYNDKTAVICNKKIISFADFFEASCQLAEFFLSKNISTGDRILFFMNDGIEQLIAYFACFFCGAIAAPVYNGHTGHDLSHYYLDIEPSLVVSQKGLIEKLKMNCSLTCDIILADETKFLDKLLSTKKKRPNKASHLSGDTDATIYYTTGSTGKPKGALFTQKLLLKNIFTMAGAIAATDRDTCHAAGNLDFNGGFCFLMTAFLNGGTIIIDEGFDAEKVLTHIIKHHVSMMFCLPERYRALLKVAKGQSIRHALRYCSVGGEPTPISLITDFKQCFGVSLMPGMGMTEIQCDIVTYAGREVKLGSVGQSVPGVELRYVDENYNDVPTGEVGEKLIKTPFVMKEYWRNPEKTKEAFIDGWFISGDLARQTPDGYVWLEGRKKDLLIVHGKNLSPVALEQEYLNLPGLKRALPIEIKNNEGTIELAVALLLEDDATIDATSFIDYCKEQLAWYKVPATVKVVTALPMNHRGKIDKAAVKNIF